MSQISIIIPVYNVGGNLLRCLDSVACQTLTDIEVICIDDGSSDGSERLLDFYAAKDSRFKVIHKDNAGVSVARNTGIQIASSPLVFFVDGDDVVEPTACEKIAGAFATDERLDILKFSAEPFPKKLSNAWLEGTLTLEDKVYDGYSDELVFEANSRPFPWNGAYRTAFLRDNLITFPVGISLGEDQVFSFKTLGRASRTRFISDCLYRYRLSRKNSAMSTFTASPAKRLSKHLDVIDAILDDWALQGRTAGESGRAMLIFVCSFVMMDILQIVKRDSRVSLLTRFREILLAHFSLDDMASLLENDRLKKPVLALCSSLEGPASFGRFSIYSVVGSIYGYKAAAMRFFGDILHVLVLPYWLVRNAIVGNIDYDDGPSIDEALRELCSRS